MARAQLLILGKGEIARSLARLARAADYPVTVCEPGVTAHAWPAGVELVEQVYTDAPWPLPAGSHAVIARGHDQDPQSLASLLHQDAEHVYLIASAARARAVLQHALPRLPDEARDLARVSAPAGLALGGRASSDIALAILAEIQWRCHGGALLPLQLAATAAAAATPGEHNAPRPCPGQRA